MPERSGPVNPVGCYVHIGRPVSNLVQGIVEAGQSLSTYYAGRWIGEVDVPTTVVCTARDRAVRPDLQRAMANAIRGASVVEVDDGHLACRNESFNAPLLRACLQVADRSRAVN